jgi:hypothetical protein
MFKPIPIYRQVLLCAALAASHALTIRAAPLTDLDSIITFVQPDSVWSKLTRL